MTSPYPHYQQAAERIDADSDLLPFRNSFIKYDWSEGDEHYRWVATAPKAELLDWAEDVNCFETILAPILAQPATKTIRNQHGTEIDWQATVNLMDDEIRERLHMERDWTSEEEFFTAYCAAHLTKYGDEFEPSKANPTW